MYNTVIHYVLCSCMPTLARIWAAMSMWHSLNKSYDSVLNENITKDPTMDPGHGGIRLGGLVHTSHAKIAFYNVNMLLNCQL